MQRMPAISLQYDMSTGTLSAHKAIRVRAMMLAITTSCCSIYSAIFLIVVSIMIYSPIESHLDAVMIRSAPTALIADSTAPADSKYVDAKPRSAPLNQSASQVSVDD